MIEAVVEVLVLVLLVEVRALLAGGGIVIGAAGAVQVKGALVHHYFLLLPRGWVHEATRLRVRIVITAIDDLAWILRWTLVVGNNGTIIVLRIISAVIVLAVSLAVFGQHLLRYLHEVIEDNFV